MGFLISCRFLSLCSPEREAKAGPLNIHRPPNNLEKKSVISNFHRYFLHTQILWWQKHFTTQAHLFTINEELWGKWGTSWKHKVSYNLCAILNYGCTISSILTPRAIGPDMSWNENPSLELLDIWDGNPSSKLLDTQHTRQYLTTNH